MRQLIKTLCALPGVSGWEDQVRDFICKAAKPYADEMRQDASGNLLVYRRGTSNDSPNIMLCAHMDEVGLLVSSITEEGYLKFVCAGGIDRRVLIGKRVLIGEKALVGIIGLRAIHLSDESERGKLPKVEDLYIDAGFTSKKEAQKQVCLGDYVTFDTVQSEFGDMFCAKALDDRVGCAALLKLMEKRYRCGVWYVFTVNEEIGTRGAFCAAFAVRPDAAVVLEGTTSADLPSLPPHRQVCKPGGGVVFPFMDASAIFDRHVLAVLRDCAQKRGVQWQTKEYVSGGTDAAAIQRTRTGCPTAVAAVAVRYLHTPSNVVMLSECEQLVEVMDEFLNAFNC